MYKFNLILSILSLAALVNIGVTTLCFLKSSQASLRTDARNGDLGTDSDSQWESTYVGDDFPKALPVDFPGQISTAIEESTRFRLDDHPSIAQAWVANIPYGIGYVRLGPEHRLFAISMYHELHCLLEIHQTIVTRSGPNHHIQHCLAYLRQSILCTADLTLEPIDFRRHNFSRQPVTGNRACRDWRQIHHFAEQNALQWSALRTSKNQV